MKKLKLVVFFAMLSFLILAGSKTAFAVSIGPAVDGTIRDGFSSSPKDNNPDLVMDDSVVQALDVPSFEDRGIIEFDISSLAFQPISSAMLELNVFNSYGPYPFLIDVFTYAGDGSVSLGDWNAGSLFTSFNYSGEAQIVLDVTTAIDNLASVGDSFAGFNFQFSVPSSITFAGPYVAFNSLEHQAGSYPSPCELNVTPIPEPATIFLLGSGLIGMAGLKKKRKMV